MPRRERGYRSGVLAAILTNSHVAVLAICVVLVCVWWLVMRRMFKDFEG